MMQLKKSKEFDPWLLGAFLVLIATSVLMVFSSTAVLSQEFYGNSTAMVKRHLMSIIMGLMCFIAVTRFNPRKLKLVAVPALFLSLMLLVFVLLPGVGRSAGGARRWISLGFIKLQPGELAKFCMVLYVAAYIDSHFSRMKNLIEGAVVPLGLIGLVGTLLLMQPDFGTTAVIGIVVFGQLLVASRIRHLFSIGIIGVLSAAVLIMQSPYRMKRLTAFLDPFAVANTSGYQLIQSLIAIGSGGVSGLGLGASKQKLFYLPAAHTDFIFAVISEELGLLGAMFILGLFLTILYRGITIARNLRYSPFLCSLSIGCTLIIVVPALLNIGVVTGLLPTKGLVLPLIAYGGTAMIVHISVMGVLFKLSTLPVQEVSKQIIVNRYKQPIYAV